MDTPNHDQDRPGRRAADPANYDWSFAKDEDVVYSDPFDGTYTVAPRAMLEELARVVDARTWGALRTFLSEERFAQAVELSHILEWPEYEGKAAHDIPDDATFDIEYIREENPDSPFLPEGCMEAWFPGDIADAFGTRLENHFGDTWLVVVDIEGLLTGLRSAGASCAKDEALVMAAYNGRKAT